MAGLVPVIHAFKNYCQEKPWMPGASSAKTRFWPG
jgi:hypothetical protein